MIQLTIPGNEPWELNSLILDFNGTLATSGSLVPGAVELLQTLSRDLSIHVLTADTYGTAQAQLHHTNVTHILKQVESGAEKAAYAAVVGADQVVAIGNGRNDILMLRTARLGIAVIGEDGAASEAITAADLVCRSIVDALALLQDRRKLLAVLRP